MNIFKVFCSFVPKKLETWKRFVTSDPEAFNAPSQYRSAVLPIIQHSLLSVSSAELVDLAETEGGNRKPTKATEFSPQSPSEICRSFYGIFRGKTGDS